MSKVKTVACDLDGTLTTGQTWKGLRDYLLAHGDARAVQRYARRNLLRALAYKVGLVNGPRFREQWILGLLRHFTGLSVAAFEEAARWAVEHEILPHCRSDIVAELQDYAQSGCRVLVLSGLFDPVPALVAQALDLSDGLGTPVTVIDGVLTGSIAEPLNVGPRKAARLDAYAGDAGKVFVAYGDSERDVLMLERSHTPVAVYPDRKLRKIAVARGWRVIQ